MRLLKRLQLFLRPAKIETTQSAEVEEMGRIMEKAPGMKDVYEQVLRDVTSDDKAHTGAEGLTAEQIVRLGVLRTRFDLSYRELSDWTGDSLSVRAFLELAPGKKVSKSAIQKNLKRVSESTWVKLNDCLKLFAAQEGIEDGKAVRGDTTTTKANVHFPTDASLLCDGVRVLTRAMNRLKAWVGAPIESSDHHRRAKKKLYKINNTRKERVRHECYLELIRVTRMTLEYAEKALEMLKGFNPSSQDSLVTLMALEAQLKHYIPLVKQVIEQAHRRIVKGEKLPANEKLFSIFEPETDIIVKGQRDIVFGHKVLIATGKSSLILQLSTLDGNPADSSLVETVIEEHKKSYGSAPRDMAFDGGFASTANRDLAKLAKVENITFSKNGSMPLESLMSSPKKHGMLMRFRAGVEGCISFFKRIFGATKILDRTKKTFAATLQCAAVAYNLTLLARFKLQQAQT
jgi:IS5 family transposase